MIILYLLGVLYFYEVLFRVTVSCGGCFDIATLVTLTYHSNNTIEKVINLKSSF